MKTIPLEKIFDISYGNKFDLNKMQPLARSSGGINFVGRSSKNHGVSGVVAPIEGVEPFGPGQITVALGGSKLLSSFVQISPFYTAQNVVVLTPKITMSFEQKVFACICIKHNRFRYSAFGREANRTIRSLEIPALNRFPSFVDATADEPLQATASPKITSPSTSIDPASWKDFRLDSLFDIKKGKRLTKAKMEPGATPFVGAVAVNNGVVCRISRAPIHEGNTITVCYNGSVGEAFYQPEPFWASDDVNVLYPKFKMSPAIGIFLATVIRLEKYRYNYGRKWHLGRMNSTTIRIPVDSMGKPAFGAMQRMVDSLPYSSQVH